MLAHLRRSVILAVVALVLTFAYAFVGTGVSQVLFKHQADGSVTANGSTLIGQNWSQTDVPGTSHRQLRLPGPARRPRPLRRLDPKPRRHPGATTRWMANGNSRRVGGAPTSGPGQGPDEQHPGSWWPTGTRGASNPTPDLVTTSGSGYDPDITAGRRPGPDPHGVQGHRHRPVGPAARSSPGRPTARSSASSAAATSTSCS